MSSLNVQGTEYFTVEKILDKRVEDGKTEYKVKWLGYPEEENSWEPITSFKACKHVVKEYENSLKEGQEGPGPSKKAPRSVKSQGSKSVVGEESVDANGEKSTEEVPSGTDTDSNPGPSRGRRHRQVRKRQVTKQVQPENVEECEQAQRNNNQEDEQEEEQKEEYQIKTHFEKDLKPEKILGATVRSGEMVFIIKWANLHKADLVRTKDANVLWPQTVIAFYEAHLAFKYRDESPSPSVSSKGSSYSTSSTEKL